MQTCLEELLPIFLGEPVLEDSDVLVSDLIFAQVAKRLDHETGHGSGGRHVLRSRGAELDALCTDLHRPAGPVGEKDDFRRHLLRKSEQIHGICSRGLDPDLVLFADGLRNGLRVRAQDAEFRVFAWVFVEPSGQASYRPCSGETAQRLVDSRTRSEVEELHWSEHPSPPFPIDSRKNFILNRLRH